jgi:methylated-DNA-[protein]-cysteine S-methyltransferase
MRVASTAELKNRTNELVRTAMAGEPVVITIYGRPAAALTPLSQDKIQEILLHRQGQLLLGALPDGPWLYTSLETPIGTVYAAYSERGVGYVDLAPGDRAFERALKDRFGRQAERDPAPPAELIRQLKTAVSSGKEFAGAIDLSMVGPFERRVLDELRHIPKGQVRTYREIASQLGHPTATRAVGNACARNPVPLLIPCHRVVRSDGGLGGYSLRGGVSLKRRLLQAEGADLSQLRAS